MRACRGVDVEARRTHPSTSFQNITSINMPFLGLAGRRLDILAYLQDSTQYEMLFVNRPIRDLLFGYESPLLAKLSKREVSADNQSRPHVSP